MISTITSKGQITLPGPIRKKYNLNTGDKIDFIEDASGNVLLQPIKTSIKSLKGIIAKPDHKVSLEDMQMAIEQEVTNR